MKTVTIQIPDFIEENEILMQLAAILFEKGVFTSGQASVFAGVTKKEFIENVGKFGVSIFGEDIEDLEKIING